MSVFILSRQKGKQPEIRYTFAIGIELYQVEWNGMKGNKLIGAYSYWLNNASFMIKFTKVVHMLNFHEDILCVQDVKMSRHMFIFQNRKWHHEWNLSSNAVAP